MPVALTFEEPSTFQVRASGSVTYDEVQAVLTDLERDPRLSMRTPIVVDARDVQAVPTTDQLRQIAVAMGQLVKRGMGPMAIITASAFVYGIARMFSVFAEAVCVKVHPFRCEQDAARWLEEQRAA